MIATLIDRMIAGYGILLTLAASGFVVAQFSGVVAAALQFGTNDTPDAERLQAWTHGGWVVGVCAALCGVVGKMWKKRRTSAVAGENNSAKGPARNRRRLRAPRIVRRHGRVASAALGGLGGALLGGMLGGTFLLLWFSIAYSPFAPRSWMSSLSVESQPVDSSAQNGLVTTTNHPVAKIAFATPLVLGAIAGAVAGGITGVTEER